MLRQSTTLRIDGIAGQTEFEFVRIPPGEFRMGSLQGLPLETPPHVVQIEKPFLLAVTPVTQAQYFSLTKEKPSMASDDTESPVDSVSWELAVAFCDRVSEIAGFAVGLPSEAQWEYACRAGTESEYFFGVDAGDLNDYAWFDLNSVDRSHPVARKRANPWGLHDMIGNVWEWCMDTWHADYSHAPVDGSPWMSGETDQPRRCLRGGAWDMDAFRCRSAYRA